MSNAGIDYRTIGYSPSAAEKELAADEVYSRAKAFLGRPGFQPDANSFIMGRSSGNVPHTPLERVLYRQISLAMIAMESAAREKNSLMVQLDTHERALATAREELGAVLDAWPAEKVVPA
ncbi:hypothetical protein [Mesorhizobium sp.]|uniref:hypothetical protein n=1 Tax=Mesorhizobium sp. TaxID=1871066 RepID=UPI001213BD7C|nr:hypothetical protein [Mesorhizobium sp.]TIX28881.1 MAG: hypothetical protein E5V35_00535 [Mesorhizobium sp.]